MADGINRLIALNPLQQPNIPQQFAAGRLAGMQLQEQEQALRAQPMLQAQKLEEARQNKRKQAMLAIAAGGPEYAKAMGYNIDPGLEQELTANPQYIEAIKRQFGETSDLQNEFLKEERKYATQAVNDIKKRAGEMQTAFGKVQNLHGRAKAGDRTASAGMVMSVARLISPGVVTDADFKQMVGAAPDPYIGLINYMMNSNSENAQALKRYFDPTGNIDADSLLATAQAVATAEAPTLLSLYGDADNRAKRAGMSERAYNTIFGDSETVESLRQYVMPDEPEPQPVQPQAAQPAQPQIPQDRRELFNLADEIIK